MPGLASPRPRQCHRLHGHHPRRVIYPLSYTTTEFSSDDNAHWSTKLVNELGREFDSSGLTKIVAAVDPMPANFLQGH